MGGLCSKIFKVLWLILKSTYTLMDFRPILESLAFGFLCGAAVWIAGTYYKEISRIVLKINNMLTIRYFIWFMSRIKIWLKCFKFVIVWARKEPMCFLSLCKDLCWSSIKSLKTKITVKFFKKKPKDRDEKKK